MNKLIISAIIIMLFASACSETETKNNSSNNDAETDTTASLSNVDLQNNNSAEIDSSGIMMFPLRISVGERSRTDLLSYSGDSDETDHWNIIFYNTHTHEQYLLSEQKMLISSYDNKNTSDKKHIYYSIITDNVNKDTVLNHYDPTYLFITDKQGKQLTCVSPVGHHLISWEYVKSSNKILTTVIKDSDKNREFGQKDEVCVFEFEPGVSTAPAEVFTAAFKSKIQKLLKRDWKTPIKK